MKIKKHFEKNSSPNGKYIFKKTDYKFLYPVRLPCPAGTLIIFDACLPHGTLPNRSMNNRMVQFLRYMPKNIFTYETLKRRRKLIKKCCVENNVELPETESI